MGSEMCIRDRPNVVSILTDVGAQIGDGASNTTAILSPGNCPTAPAALICASYMGAGHTDWHLPSIEELRTMRANIGQGISLGPNANIAQFSDELYVSSSESDGTNTWFLNFMSNGIGLFAKDSGSFRVRPIRAF